jgi:hypothetical protein
MAIGWAAVGIAEAGGMFGADVISFTAATEQLVDGYILDERQVLVDDSQDWTLTSSTVDDGWIIVEATRKLSTGDTQDHVIRNDKDLPIAPTRFIAAWGDSESISYHGENKARTSLRIFADPSSSSSSESEALLEVISESTDGYFDVLEDGYEIPKSDTTYRENCKTYNELKNQFGIKSDLTMIAVTPVITEETRAFIHHFTVYLVPDCKAKDFSKEMIYGWAPGAEGAFTTPEDVGIPMFDSESNQAIQVEIHYNNPKLISGMKDSSGVRIHYTNTPRLHKAGVLMVGDPFIGLDGEGINDGLTKHEFTCPGTCSWLFLDGPVTVFAESLHMHRTGVRMVNEVIREGDVFHTASVEVYDFDQQGRFVNCQPLTIITFSTFSGSFHTQQEQYQLKAGDSFRTTCYYKDGKKFGKSSQDEMCIGYLLYYPMKKFSEYPFICPYPGVFPCTQKYLSTDLSGYDGLDRTFGTPRLNLLNETLSPLPSGFITDEKMHTPAPSVIIQASEIYANELKSDNQSSSNAPTINWFFVLALFPAAMLYV